jgi:hypothetical protein
MGQCLGPISRWQTGMEGLTQTYIAGTVVPGCLGLAEVSAETNRSNATWRVPDPRPGIQASV